MYLVRCTREESPFGLQQPHLQRLALKCCAAQSEQSKNARDLPKNSNTEPPKYMFPRTSKKISNSLLVTFMFVKIKRTAFIFAAGPSFRYVYQVRFGCNYGRLTLIF